jgi:hypothetical protein
MGARRGGIREKGDGVVKDGRRLGIGRATEGVGGVA